MSTSTHAQSLPTTGNHYLDSALDRLDPAAKVAIVALLQRHGQDPAVDLVRDRLREQVEWLENPDTLSNVCASLGYEPEHEADVTFWMSYLSEWDAQKGRY